MLRIAVPPLLPKVQQGRRRIETTQLSHLILHHYSMTVVLTSRLHIHTLANTRVGRQGAIYCSIASLPLTVFSYHISAWQDSMFDCDVKSPRSSPYSKRAPVHRFLLYFAPICGFLLHFFHPFFFSFSINPGIVTTSHAGPIARSQWVHVVVKILTNTTSFLPRAAKCVGAIQ